jgi:hypothetical protein
MSDVGQTGVCYLSGALTNSFYAELRRFRGVSIVLESLTQIQKGVRLAEIQNIFVYHKLNIRAVFIKDERDEPRPAFLKSLPCPVINLYRENVEGDEW